MEEHPKNPKDPRPTTKRDYQGASVVIDPETAKLDNEGEPPEHVPEQIASSAKPRSMPWPEVPTTRSSERKKKAPRPTKPSLDDEWLGEFQEPAPAFPSNDFNSEPAKAPLNRTTNAQTRHKKPASDSARPTLENEWIAVFEKPPQTSTVGTSPDTPQPPVSETSAVTAEAAAPDPDLVIQTSTNTVTSAAQNAEGDNPPTTSTTRTDAGLQDRDLAHIPGSTSYTPVFVTPTPEPQAPSLPPDPLKPHPTPPTAVPTVPTASPLQPPRAGLDALPDISPTPETFMPPSTDAASFCRNPEERADLPKLDKGNASNTPSYAPVSLPPSSEPPFIPSRSLNLVTSGPEATEMPFPDQRPSPSKIQELSKTPSPSSTNPAAIVPPLSTSTPPPIPHSNMPINPKMPETMREPKKDVISPPPEPTLQPARPMAFEPSPPTRPIPFSPMNSAPPAHNATTPSLDEEWVAPLDDARGEMPSTIISPPPADSKPQASNKLEIPQQPNKYVAPNKWLPTDQQQSPPTPDSAALSRPDSDASERPAHFPEDPGQQGTLGLKLEAPEDFISSGKTSVNQVVQAWPSTRSPRATKKFQSTPSTLEAESSDALKTESDVSFGLDSGGFGHEQPGEEDYAPIRLRHPSFTGDGSTLFGIFTTNTVWTLLTFGIYSFWGRVNIRRYLCSQTKFAGARFAFHGTGGELLLGWLKALLALGIPYLGLNYFGSQHTEAVWRWTINGLTGLLVASLIPMAIVGSHRYRMSRTSWRGIRFSFRRSIAAFTILYLKGALLSLVTLGLYYPIFEHARRAFLTSGTHFGNQAFGFDGDPKALGQLYFKGIRRLVLTLVTAEVFLLATWFLARQLHPKQVVDLVFMASVGTGAVVIPILLGLWFWFQAAKQRYMWNHTTFGQSRFRATMKGRHLFELKSTNLILLLGSLGLAWPWVQKRNLQFQYYHIGFRGPLRLQQILQQAASASPMGEELAGFFDAGFEM